MFKWKCLSKAVYRIEILFFYSRKVLSRVKSTISHCKFNNGVFLSVLIIVVLSTWRTSSTTMRRIPRVPAVVREVQSLRLWRNWRRATMMDLCRRKEVTHSLPSSSMPFGMPQLFIVSTRKPQFQLLRRIRRLFQ